MRSIAGWFPWLAGGSFLVLTLSGWYNAVYNVPARTPGLFDPNLVQRLPFGSAYLMTFLVKMGLTATMVVAAVALALALRRAYGSALRPVAGGAVAAAIPLSPVERWPAILSGLNVVLGIFVFVDVVVLGYLHILTHIGGVYGAS